MVPEETRARAARLFAEGRSRAEVARLLGVSRASTSRWYRAWEAGGWAPAPRGPRPRLDPTQAEALARALRGPPRAQGFDLEGWTLAAVASLLERRFGVRYHRRHVGRLLRRLGWIVPPVGRTAAHALRGRAVRDPEGNPLLILERAGATAGRAPG